MFSSILSIVLHPVAFLINLYRTITIASRNHQTFTVKREHDGYIVQMRKPLSPEGQLQFYFASELVSIVLLLCLIINIASNMELIV